MPDGYEVRRPTRGDLSEIAAIAAADELDLIGEVVTTEDDLAQDWNYANFLLERVGMRVQYSFDFFEKSLASC